MTSIIVNEHGGPEKYEVTDDSPAGAATPADGQLQVSLSLAGVNFLDVVQRRGGTPVTAPFAPGVEGVGTVTAVGAGVDGFSVGDRVGWMTGGQGSFSSTALVRADKAVPLPDDIDDEIAVAALMQGITAHYLTTSTFPISAGDVVVVHAAAGGLGQMLTQIAAAKGATVIGTTSTEEKAEIARANGAAHVFGYDDFAEKIREVSSDGEGASVIFDGVGATTFEGDLKTLRTRGTLVVVGNASGPVPAVDVNTLSASGSLFLTRPTVVDHVRTPEELRSRTDEIFEWIRSGDLTVHIGDRFPLTEVAAAFTALESRATTGKIILEH